MFPTHHEFYHSQNKRYQTIADFYKPWCDQNYEIAHKAKSFITSLNHEVLILKLSSLSAKLEMLSAR